MKRSPTSPPSAGRAATSKQPGRVEPTWAALRPVLIGFLLAANTATVASLAIARPTGFVAPLIAFSIALAGLIGLEVWAVAHRHDDDPPGRR
jgi:hypothetical protein